MAIFYCQDKNCEKIFTGEELAGIDLFAPDAKLPCGHKPSQLVFCASALREAKEKAQRWDEVEPRLKGIAEGVCDMCAEGAPSCGNDLFGRKCPRFC